ncbi:pectate lyase [Luteolibacter arcticus]|uniref:Pectate lyase n=1 Tax=Luteolibacter arcticus TaxID=1581411 RepID=A0ABT3GN79_9BACT|nr:pectate lyase [Luteolibacter arcticus]MCW1924976.1 pectate lyase [Luteolibacter arcticus]
MNPRLPLLAALLLPGMLFADAADLAGKPDDWFRSHEGRSTLSIVLSWQSPQGSWPKNKDTTTKPYDGKRDKLEGTFDNKATTGELRLLAHAFKSTGDDIYRDAFLKGFEHILEAQYPNGGWPQFHPPGEGYHRHITFNDGTMVRLLELLHDSQGYDFIDNARKRKATEAFDRGIACILKCQIVIDGRPTVWCAQHDEVTFAPAKARAYELPSLSGGESAGILHFLMSLEKPSPEVIRAVKAGVAWFDSAKLTGIRFERSGGDGRVISDPSAKPLWARFYDLETGKPFFCDRDGVKKATVAEIGKERRKGYAWYGNWGDSVQREYGKWDYR